jgi:NAD+ synthase (glutamine-hydrolysing)
MEFINITIAQLNFQVGDLEGNLKKIFDAWASQDHLAHLVVFPELALTGYPPQDLLHSIGFLKECKKKLEDLIDFSKRLNSLAVVGMPYYEGDPYNSLVLIGRGKLLGVYHKTFLPNYSVFDEKRYFRKGERPLMVSLNGVKLGFSVCEDIWHPDGWERFYALCGAEVLININASPYYVGKYQFKESFLKARAQDNLAYVVYANLVGGQDDLVFDGRSLIIDPEGRLIFRAFAFKEMVKTVSLPLEKVKSKRLMDIRLREKRVDCPSFLELQDERGLPYLEGSVERGLEEEEEIYRALELGLRDYFFKTGFKKAVVGISGGIDSALTACLGVDALGKENVVGVFMPSPFTSEESKKYAFELAENLGIELLVYPIDEVFNTYGRLFESKEISLAEENLQARIRANILFYLSNKHHWLVLSTSNKSESAVGYTTIYGDMAGGFAPIKDVYKTMVYRLARYRNSIKPDIPEGLFVRPPTAELKPNQTDQDTLPPYELLDQILSLHIEEGFSKEEIVRRGFDRTVVEKVFDMLRRAEYKRKQAPLGTKITKRNFNGDWRMPVINFWKG